MSLFKNIYIDFNLHFSKNYESNIMNWNRIKKKQQRKNSKQIDNDQLDVNIIKESSISKIEKIIL